MDESAPSRALKLLADLNTFSRLAIGLPLRPYQAEPAQAILHSILHRQGLEFLLVFPRQSGKNETVAQLLVYLLNLLHRRGGNIIYAAIGDALGLGINRLDQRLDNPLNMGYWHKLTKPRRRQLGRATITFLSSHPAASTRGQTARNLLVIDEAQDQVASHIEAVFTPMRAAYNATALYIGTVKSTSDYLWQKKLELERDQARDGTRRVFLTHPETVCRQNPDYRTFLDAQVRRYGRHHPIVASEYFLEALDAEGGMFPPRRLALMRGDHARQYEPETNHLYVATLDVAGQDEAATDAIAQLSNPARDYTVATVFEVIYPPPDTYAPGPTYRALDVFVDHGSRHFETHPDRPSLADRLLAWLNHWNVAHITADESGVGEGLCSWLSTSLRGRPLFGFPIAARGRKAHLGSMFLALIETNRFKYWINDKDQPLSHGWWFWKQAKACAYEVPPDARLDTDLRWYVPNTHKTDTPAGPKPTHDDRLLSAALIAEFDRQLRTGDLRLGTAHSEIIPGADPFRNMQF